MVLCCYPVHLTARDNMQTNILQLYCVLYFGSKEMLSGLRTAKRNGRKAEEKELHEFPSKSRRKETLYITDRINNCSVSP